MWLSSLIIPWQSLLLDSRKCSKQPLFTFIGLGVGNVMAFFGLIKMLLRYQAEQEKLKKITNTEKKQSSSWRVAKSYYFSSFLCLILFVVGFVLAPWETVFLGRSANLLSGSWTPCGASCGTRVPHWSLCRHEYPHCLLVYDHRTGVLAFTLTRKMKLIPGNDKLWQRPS